MARLDSTGTASTTRRARNRMAAAQCWDWPRPSARTGGATQHRRAFTAAREQEPAGARYLRPPTPTFPLGRIAATSTSMAQRRGAAPPTRGDRQGRVGLGGLLVRRAQASGGRVVDDPRVPTRAYYLPRRPLSFARVACRRSLGSGRTTSGGRRAWVSRARGFVRLRHQTATDPARLGPLPGAVEDTGSSAHVVLSAWHEDADSSPRGTPG